jgi:hypothetical protein
VHTLSTKLLGVKASMATAQRHMIVLQEFNPMRPPPLRGTLSGILADVPLESRSGSRIADSV